MHQAHRKLASLPIPSPHQREQFSQEPPGDDVCVLPVDRSSYAGNQLECSNDDGRFNCSPNLPSSSFSLLRDRDNPEIRRADTPKQSKSRDWMDDCSADLASASL